MAISYVGGDLDEQGANTTSLTLTLPTHQTGDFGIIYARADESGTVPVLAVTSATGWHELVYENYLMGSNDSVDAVWWKVFESSSETDPVITISTSQEHSASVSVFRGVDVYQPIEGSRTDEDLNNTLPVNPAITTVTDNACVVLLHGANQDDITVAGAPTGFTMGQSLVGATKDNRQQFVAYDLDVGTAGTVTPGAWTHTSSPTSISDYVTHTIALKPSGSAPPITFIGADVDGNYGSASITLSMPTQSADDLGIVVACGRHTANTLDMTLSGWTELIDRNDNYYLTYYMRFKVFYKVLGASEADPVITRNWTGQMSCSLGVFRGADTTTPVDVSANGHDTNTPNPTSDPVTTTVDNCAIVLAHFATDDQLRGPGTPDGYQLYASWFGDDKPERQQFAAFMLDAGTAGTVTPTAWQHDSISAAATDSSTATIALAPAAAPASGPAAGQLVMVVS